MIEARNNEQGFDAQTPHKTPEIAFQELAQPYKLEVGTAIDAERGDARVFQDNTHGLNAIFTGSRTITHGEGIHQRTSTLEDHVFAQYWNDVPEGRMDKVVAANHMETSLWRVAQEVEKFDKRIEEFNKLHPDKRITVSEAMKRSNVVATRVFEDPDGELFVAWGIYGNANENTIVHQKFDDAYNPQVAAPQDLSIRAGVTSALEVNDRLVLSSDNLKAAIDDPATTDNFYAAYNAAGEGDAANKLLKLGEKEEAQPGRAVVVIDIVPKDPTANVPAISQPIPVAARPVAKPTPTVVKVRRPRKAKPAAPNKAVNEPSAASAPVVPAVANTQKLSEESFGRHLKRSLGRAASDWIHKGWDDEQPDLLFVNRPDQEDTGESLWHHALRSGKIAVREWAKKGWDDEEETPEYTRRVPKQRPAKPAKDDSARTRRKVTMPDVATMRSGASRITSATSDVLKKAAVGITIAAIAGKEAYASQDRKAQARKLGSTALKKLKMLSPALLETNLTARFTDYYSDPEKSGRRKVIGAALIGALAVGAVAEVTGFSFGAGHHASEVHRHAVSHTPHNRHPAKPNHHHRPAAAPKRPHPKGGRKTGTVPPKDRHPATPDTRKPGGQASGNIAPKETRVALKAGQNPWTVAQHDLIAHGNAHPSVAQISHRWLQIVRANGGARFIARSRSLPVGFKVIVPAR